MMRSFLLSFILLIAFVSVYAQNPYVTIWQTDIEGYGTSANNQIEIPAIGDFSYTWEEIASPNNNGSGTGSGLTLLTFPVPGIYRLSMTPVGPNPFNQMVFAGNGDDVKLLEIVQWGDVAWASFEDAYWEAENLSITATDLPNLSNVYSMSNAFRESGIDEIPNLNNWDMSSVTDMSKMFYGLQNFNQYIGDWDVSNVGDMSKMFFHASSFNQPIGSWNTANVQSFSSMFEGATAFNQPIGNWNTSNVWDISYMFAMASSFNQPIGDWDVSNVSNMNGVFYMASAFNKPLENWNVSNVTLMAFMFVGSAFNQPIGNWDVSNVIDMYAMFSNNTKFNQPIGNWVTKNVEDMAMMFQSASAFNQPIENWNVSKVNFMYDMFKNATKFDQPLGNWNLKMLSNFQYADNALSFKNTAMSCINYSLSLHGWAQNNLTASNIKLAANSRKYSPDVVNDRNSLVNAKFWVITGDELGDCTLVSLPETESSSFTVSPNPAKDEVFVSGLKGGETLILMDQTGKFMWLQTADSPSVRIDLHQIDHGIYNLIIRSEGRNITKKVVKAG